MSSEPWVVAIIGLISGGGLGAIISAVNEFRKAPNKKMKDIATVDQNILTLSRTRDELSEDNDRLRAERDAERAANGLERQEHAKERAAWDQERRRMQQEIMALEWQIRAEREESDRRYDALLAQVARLSARNAQTQHPPPQDQP